MNCARPEGPKALRGSREGEKPREQVQINLYSASLQNPPEAPLQTQTGSPECDPENVTCDRIVVSGRRGGRNPGRRAVR